MNAKELAAETPTITRKFIWIRSERWIVYCAGRQLVAMTLEALS